MWVFSVLVLFRIFGDEQVPIEQLHGRTHPPARLRQFMTLRTVEAALPHFGAPDLLSLFSAIDEDVTRHAEECYAMLGGEQPQFSFLEYVRSEDAQLYTGGLLTNWKQLRPQLIPFARWKLVD